MKTIERLRELEKAATTSPWEAPFLWDKSGLTQNKVRHAPVPGGTWKTDTEVICTFPEDRLNRANAILIAATRNALPALLAVVEAAEKLRAAMNPVDDDGTRKRYVLQPLIDAGKELDAALRAVEGEG